MVRARERRVKPCRSRSPQYQQRSCGTQGRLLRTSRWLPREWMTASPAVSLHARAGSLFSTIRTLSGPVEPVDVLQGSVGSALGREEFLLGGVVGGAAGPLFWVVGVLQGSGQCGQAPRGRFQVQVLPRQVYLESAQIVDASLLCLQTVPGDVDLAGGVVELPPETVELVFQFAAQGTVVAADPPVPARGVRLDYPSVAGGPHAGAGYPTDYTVEAGTFEVGVLLDTQVREPLEFLAQPPLVGRRRGWYPAWPRPSRAGGCAPAGAPRQAPV
jgi:hypothetical protein